MPIPLPTILGRLAHTPSARETPSGARPPVVGIAVFALLAVGVALRAREYFRIRPFWYDESYLLLNVANVSFADLLGPLQHNLVIPGFFLWLERACFLAFGMTEWGMRLPAFLAGLAALAVMVPLARRVVGGSLWWFPVALVALSRHASDHGAEVRPYTVDVLLSAAILWLTTITLEGGRSARRAAAPLVLLAVFGPWFSFPSVFGLAGAGGALFVSACRQGGRSRWALFGALTLATAASALALWWVQARHLYYHGMHEHWGPHGWGGFPDYSRPSSWLLWPVTRAVEVGNYGIREVGPMLACLGLIGGVILFRRSPALAAAVATPFIGALAASCLGKYPLAHRTTMFLQPALWVAAGVGLAGLLSTPSRRRLAALVPLALLGVEAVNAARDLARPTPTGTREAFAHVRQSRESGDVVWVSHVEVYETYFGNEANVYGAFDPPARVIGTATRVWVIDYTSPGSPPHRLRDALAAAGFREAEYRPTPRIVVALYVR